MTQYIVQRSGDLFPAISIEYSFPPSRSSSFPPSRSRRCTSMLQRSPSISSGRNVSRAVNGTRPAAFLQAVDLLEIPRADSGLFPTLSDGDDTFATTTEITLGGDVTSLDVTVPSSGPPLFYFRVFTANSAGPSPASNLASEQVGLHPPSSHPHSQALDRTRNCPECRPCSLNKQKKFLIPNPKTGRVFAWGSGNCRRRDPDRGVYRLELGPASRHGNRGVREGDYRLLGRGLPGRGANR